MTEIAETALDETERRVVQRLVDLLQSEYGDDLFAVWLYGSRARGEDRREDSDVDLLVVTAGGRERDLSRVTSLVSSAAEVENADPTRFAAQVADPEWIEDRRRIESFFIREVDRDKSCSRGRGESPLGGVLG